MTNIFNYQEIKLDFFEDKAFDMNNLVNDKKFVINKIGHATMI